MPLSHIRQRAINGYQRIMACPLSKGWVMLVVVHFIVQIALQGITLKENQRAKNATELCLELAQVPIGLPLLEGDNLSICDGIPGHNNVTCIVVASAGVSPLSPMNNVESRALTDFDLDGMRSIELPGGETFITGRCAISLQWINNVFRDNAAEDIATICFQFWLLIVSLLAVLQDSIPHLAVCIASHLLDVGWAGFRIRSTITLRQDYYKFVVDGACGGNDLLGDWWDQRLSHAAPLFGTNVIILILLGALSAVMFRQYAMKNFSRVGASPPITRMYKIALSFSAFLQLAAFFTILAVGMWIDRVSCAAISALAMHVRAYQTTFFVVAAIIAPWVISGWWAIFREIKWAFVLFGVLHVFLLSLWPMMFASTTYRYIFRTWSFFACVSVTSYLFVIATAIMAVICRLHFGRGLGHFLRVEADLSSSGFPGSFFTNDPTYVRGGSPAPSDFNFLDIEKMRKGSTESDEGGPMQIRPYTADSNKPSIHTLTFETSTNGSKTPIKTALPPVGATSAAIIRAFNKGGEKALSTIKVNSESRIMSYASRINSDGPKSTIFTRETKRSWIQPPPEAYLQAPSKETRSRKETPSLITQATATSTNSYSQAVITLARKDPVVSATARTMRMSTMSSKRAPSPVDAVTLHQDRPSFDSGTSASINTVPQQKQTLIRTVNGTQRTIQFAASVRRETIGGAGRDVHPRPDSYGRI